MHQEWRGRFRSQADTERFGACLGKALRGGEVLALYGDLGTGKTTLVQAMASGLGIPPQHVTSPTFMLIQEYQGRHHLAHADFYRIEHPHAVHDTGFTEFLNSRTVLVIEWAENISSELPLDRLDIHLAHRTRYARGVVIRAGGNTAQRFMRRVLRSYPSSKNTRRE